MFSEGWFCFFRNLMFIAIDRSSTASRLSGEQPGTEQPLRGVLHMLESTVIKCNVPGVAWVKQNLLSHKPLVIGYV